MSHRYLCPKCGVQLQSGVDVTGRSVRCLGCQTVFTAGEVGAIELAPMRKRSRAPIFVGGVLLFAIALTVGLVVRFRPSEKSEPNATEVVQALPPAELPIGDPNKPIPLPTVNVRYIEAGSDGGEEDLPLEMDLGPKPKKGANDPKLEDVGPPELLPNLGKPKPPEPKLAPKDPGPKPPEAKADPKTPEVVPPTIVPKPVPTIPTVQGAVDFTAIDEHTLRAPPEAERTMDSLAAYLSRGAKNELEKARAVYRWVTDRIAYDVPALLANKLPDPSAEYAFRTRVCVCEGYAKLFVALCGRCGLESVMVAGYVKLGDSHGQVTRPDHAWSTVRIDERWYLVDATWGAGSIDGRAFKKQFNEYYFRTPPAQLSFTHLAEEERWQLRQPALTLADFNRQPNIGSELFELGVTLESVQKAIREAPGVEFVKVFGGPSKSMRVVYMPLTARLKAGTEYKFEFKGDDLNSMAFVRDGQFVYFKRDGKSFKATIKPARGTLVVGARAKNSGDKGYWGVAEYTVE